MNEDTLARLCRLAPALKHSAHLLLHHHHNLSLDTHTLLDMQEAFSLILEMEQHTNFHVLPPNHRQHPAIPHLQMLYDLLQKVAGLKLWGRQDRQQATVSLRCFRSLRTLELAGVTVASLRALQALRSQLKRLVVTRGLSCLADLFVRCGADQAGEFVWEQLVEATLSHNALQDGRLDDSLRLLPNLKVLDISHCGLQDVACLRLLPALCYLDVSHNNLTDLPQLTPASSPGLVVLLASHNSIHSLHGLQALTGLEEVNIAYNFIATRAGLVTLAALPRLRSLCIEGNPVCCDPGHCSAVLCLLHPATLPSQFLLDGHSLTPTEQDLIGSVSSPPELLHSPSPSSPVTDPPRQHQERARDTHAPPSLPGDALKQAVIAPRRRSRKKKTTRHITLGGEEEEEEEEEGGESGPPSLSHPSPYLYIPPTPPTSMLQDNIPAAPPPSLVLGGPLSSNHGTLSEALAALAPPPPVRPNQDEEHSDKLLEEILQAKPSQSPSIPPPATAAATDDGGGGGEKEEEEEEEEEEVEVVEEEEEVEGFYRKVEDLQVGCSSDEEEEEEGALLILAQRLKEEEEEEEEEMRRGGERERAGDVILSLTSAHFKEKHFVSTKTLFRWDLRCIQTLEEQQQQQQQQQSTTTIKMTFDTTRPSHKSRIYTMETEDCLNLQAALTPLPRMSVSCSSCRKMQSSRGSQGECKDCGRQKAPLQLTSTPLPPLQLPPSALCEDNNGDGDGGGGSGSGGGGGGDSAPNHHSDRPQHTQEPHHMQESSSSGSLTGSVCTAYERGGPVGAGGCSSLPVTPFKSNPLVHPSTMDATDATDCSSTLYLSAESNLGDHTPTTPLFADTLTKEEGGGGGGEEEGGLVSIAPWVESLLHTHTGYHWLWWEDIAKEETLKKKKEEEEEEESNSSSSSNSTLMKPNNPITYNYEDLSQVDHRLKLYLEVCLLQQTDEQLLGVVKAVMVLSSKKREFRGLLVLSSVMFYLLQVTGPEDDTPQSWLEEVGRGPLAEIEEVHSLFQRQGVALSLSLSTATSTSPTLLLVCLADSHRSNCFFNFLMEALGGQGLAPSLAEAAPAQEEALVALLGEEQGETGPPSLLSIVSLLTDGGCSESQYLIITNSDLVLYLADLTWYLPTTTTTTATTTTTGGGLVTTAAQKIHNVTSVEVHTPHHLSIHFLDEVTQKESLWRVHVASPQAGWQLIEALRAPWSDLFSVQLQVTHHTHHE